MLDAKRPVAGGDDSVVVFKVEPGNWRLVFFEGDVDETGFDQGVWRNAAISGSPTDGYLVARARPGRKLGLVSVHQTNGDGLFDIAATFTACGGAELLVFQAPERGAGYVADIRIRNDAGVAGFEFKKDLDGALRHVRQHFPGMSDSLQDLDFTLMRAAASCHGGTVTIPVYMGG